MLKILKKVRKRFKKIKKTSKSKSELLIRRRMFVEEIRSATYYKSYVAEYVESIFMRIVMLGFIVFNITNFIMSLYVNVFPLSLVILFLLGYRLILNEKKHLTRLNREIRKTKKVLDSVDSNQELPLDLVYWCYSAQDFIKRTK